MLCARMKPRVLLVSGERTERLENIVVNKHVNTHASSEMANYIEKLQHIVY